MEGNQNMSLTYYGIYLAYPPTVDLRAEGLGRHLAAFLKGASERTDVRFVVVCPSWSKKSIEALCKNEGVPEGGFDLCCPKFRNIPITLHEIYINNKKKIKPERKLKLIKRIGSFLGSLEIKMTQKILISRSGYELLINIILLTRLTPVFFFRILLMLYRRVQESINRFKKTMRHVTEKTRTMFHKPLQFIQGIAINPKKNFAVYDKFKVIEDYEMRLMLEIIDNMPEVKAWYTPTAFWPSFNLISAPKLMCVPDVVLSEFPVGFASVGGGRFLDRFNMVEQAIRGGTNFVTYSKHVKEQTLMTRYGIKPQKISVIPHAPNRLDHLVNVQGYSEPENASIRYCQQRLRSALAKAPNADYTALFKNTEVKFFFYASQFRPSKNIMVLLRAYKFLLHNRFIGHKLIMTGSRGILNQVDAFIDEHNLSKDVLLLHNLSLEELACCYKLADIVVNPSLSEGGCPFTFTEALSVNTPVIMSRIPVTLEVITDPKIQEMMLFDPYNWKDLAERLEWAVHHKTILLEAQRSVYQQLEKRTWQQVVNDYINVLDSLATSDAPVFHLEKEEAFEL